MLNKKKLRCTISLVTCLFAFSLKTSAQFGITFSDVTQQAGIQSTGPSYGAAWGDMNGDGKPDLYVGNHRNVAINVNPPQIYLNKGNGTFNSNAYSLNLNGQSDLHGAAFADFDNDGDDDLLILTGGSFGNLFFVNHGDTALLDSAAFYGLQMQNGRGRTPQWIDLNNDGWLDVIICNQKRADGTNPTTLFTQNNGIFTDANATGNFTFTNSLEFVLFSDLHGPTSKNLMFVSPATQKLYEFTWPLSALSNTNTARVSDAATADFNNDFKPDFFYARHASESAFHQPSTNECRVLFRLAANEEHGFRFAATSDVGFQLEWSPYQTIPVFIGSGGINPTGQAFQLSSSDANNHGIYAHTPGATEAIYIGYDTAVSEWEIYYSATGNNQVAVTLQSASPITPVTSIGFDIIPPGDVPSLFFHTATGFALASATAGFTDSLYAAAVVAGDFDNDMDVDIFIACQNSIINTPDLLFENDGNGNFTIVPGAAGAAGSTSGRAESVTLVDYDMDGFLDLYVTNGEGQYFLDNAPNQLFRNSGNANHWTQIDLEGTLCNRDAIGATVYVTTGGITQMREHTGGMHSASQNFKRLHFGLGQNSLISQIEVHWPDGSVTVYQNIPSDQFLHINQSSGISSVLSDKNKKGEWSLYPNPATSAINISLPENSQTGVVFLTDISGRVLKEAAFSRNQSLITLPLNGMEAGVYLAIVKTQKVKSVRKFIVGKK